MKIKYLYNFFIFFLLTLPAFSVAPDHEGERYYVIKVINDTLFIDRPLPERFIGEKVKIYSTGENIVHPITGEEMTIHSVTGIGEVVGVEENYSIVRFPRELTGQIEYGNYIRFKDYRVYDDMKKDEPEKEKKEILKVHEFQTTTEIYYSDAHENYYLPTLSYHRYVDFPLGGSKDWYVEYLGIGSAVGYGELGNNYSGGTIPLKIALSFFEGALLYDNKFGMYGAIGGGVSETSPVGGGIAGFNWRRPGNYKFNVQFDGYGYMLAAAALEATFYIYHYHSFLVDFGWTAFPSSPYTLESTNENGDKNKLPVKDYGYTMIGYGLHAKNGTGFILKAGLAGADLNQTGLLANLSVNYRF